MPAKKNPADAAREEALASVLSSTTSAQIARILGKRGTTVRNFVRGTLGVYVNDGAPGAKHSGSRIALTDDDKRAVFDKFYTPAQ